MKEHEDDATAAGSEALDDAALEQVSGGIDKSTPKLTELKSEPTDTTRMKHEVREHVS